jgi:hypothetical protein
MYSYVKGLYHSTLVWWLYNSWVFKRWYTYHCWYAEGRLLVSEVIWELTLWSYFNLKDIRPNCTVEDVWTLNLFFFYHLDAQFLHSVIHVLHIEVFNVVHILQNKEIKTSLYYDGRSEKHKKLYERIKRKTLDICVLAQEMHTSNMFLPYIINWLINFFNSI